MKIALLTTMFFHDCKEIMHNVDGKKVHGTDRIIFGGAERLTYDLCKLLQEDGHIVTVFQPFQGITKSFTKKYKGIDFVMLPNNGGWSMNTCADLNWQFNENAALYDLRIYFATFLAFPNAISPCIALSHGIYWDNTQGVNTVQLLNEADRKEFMRRQLYGFTAPDVVVSVDSNVKKVIQAMEPGADRKTQIIYNYVDCQKFHPGEKTWEGTNILFPRRLTVLRGSTEVTKAFMSLPQYNFTLAGQAHDDNAAQAFFKAHEHRKNVNFIHREMDDMPEVYRQADISLVPTISTEGLSLSLLESMASGLPVITTPVGGIGDAVIPGYNALIYDPNHENLADYITALAEDKALCEKFSKRNREIAVECFDIEIWKARWRALLAQFGIVPEKQYVNALNPAQNYDGEFVGNTPKKPKLVAMMLTHNETGRYLERVIDNTLSFCDEIVILDDHSTDGTYELIFELWRKYGDRIHCSKAKSSWSNESELRKELLDATYALDPEWIIAVDADELYESDKMKEHLPHIMSQTQADWVGFRFYDMWDDERYYRDDDVWPAGNCYAPRMFRVKPGVKYEFANKRRHCGSIPENVMQSPGLNSPIRVKHLGWMKQDDRDKKYLDRITDDPNNEFFPQEIYDAILDEHPKLVEWDDNNPWQTGKLTIAYPPGMEWNIMQQRPHHLLKLAASERYRVFFGDDTAPGTYEPIPYLTVVKEWESVKEVDVLYITSPTQMDRCGHVKYKKLIYDCCDWQGEADRNIMNKADVILCASKLLYSRVCDYKQFKEKTIYLPNACEYDHFSRTPDPSPESPEPIIGYMGCIHPVMIDEKIINALAEKYKVLVIGQNKGVEFDNPNIYTTGHVPYSELPRYLANCTACIIPFRTDNDYLRYSAPIKVYEYLSSGRPVVASPIPELLHLADNGIIRVVDNDDLIGWIAAVADAIKDFPDNRAKKFASDNTWKKRWKTFKKECLER